MRSAGDLDDLACLRSSSEKPRRPSTSARAAAYSAPLHDRRAAGLAAAMGELPGSSRMASGRPAKCGPFSASTPDGRMIAEQPSRHGPPLAWRRLLASRGEGQRAAGRRGEHQVHHVVGLGDRDVVDAEAWLEPPVAGIVDREVPRRFIAHQFDCAPNPPLFASASALSLISAAGAPCRGMNSKRVRPVVRAIGQQPRGGEAFGRPRLSVAPIRRITFNSRQAAASEISRIAPARPAR